MMSFLVKKLYPVNAVSGKITISNLSLTVYFLRDYYTFNIFALMYIYFEFIYQIKALIFKGLIEEFSIFLILIKGIIIKIYEYKYF